MNLSFSFVKVVWFYFLHLPVCPFCLSGHTFPLPYKILLLTSTTSGQHFPIWELQHSLTCSLQMVTILSSNFNTLLYTLPTRMHSFTSVPCSCILLFFLSVGGVKVVCEYSAQQEGVVQEELTLVNRSRRDSSIKVRVHARVMGENKHVLKWMSESNFYNIL